ncbi:MAG: polysaccharide deacetylase family protein [Alphaproteobacteria bacterium]
MPDLVVTTSWDDGHPADLRIAERLARHGLRGTFYVPAANSEGRAVMDAAALRALAASGFEIAGHTRDHRRLTGLNASEARRQVAEGKTILEDMLGAPVHGFAYPGGRRNAAIRAIVADAGFRHARTTCMLCLDPGPDTFSMATTLQLYPHRIPALLRNWLRNGGGIDRLRIAAAWLEAGSPDRAAARIADIAAIRGGVFHLWGHSWEIERAGLWPHLDRVLAILSERATSRATNAEIAGIR